MHEQVINKTQKEHLSFTSTTDFEFPHHHKQKQQTSEHKQQTPEQSFRV